MEADIPPLVLTKIKFVTGMRGRFGTGKQNDKTDERWAEFSDWAQQGQLYKDELLRLVDADTRAFNAIMIAFGLPKGTPEEKAVRTEAIQGATKTAIEVPFRVMEVAAASLPLLPYVLGIRS